jgi:hypothetical protein
MVTETCWHCAGSGEVEPEVALQDHLLRVAHALAIQEETEYRKARDNDPEGEGYEFCAAENMMSAHDYFEGRVSDRKFKLVAQMQQLNSSIQNALLEWYEKRLSERPTETPSPNGMESPNEGEKERLLVQADLLEQFTKDLQSGAYFGRLDCEDDIPF